MFHKLVKAPKAYIILIKSYDPALEQNTRIALLAVTEINTHTNKNCFNSYKL